MDLLKENMKKINEMIEKDELLDDEIKELNDVCIKILDASDKNNYISKDQMTMLFTLYYVLNNANLNEP